MENDIPIRLIAACAGKPSCANRARPKSVQKLEVEAAAGDPRAQYQLATRYRLGRGVRRNKVTAIRWLKSAAEQGDPNAQNDLGTAYRNGYGVPQDKPESVRWYQMAAEQGQATALYNLGKSYLRGYGTAIDLGAAFKYLAQAAKFGYRDAERELANIYRFGLGVEKDLVEAAEYHIRLARTRDTGAMDCLWDYHEELETLALQGNRAAAISVGEMYEGGLGVEQNRRLARAWFLWADEKCAPVEPWNFRHYNSWVLGMRAYYRDLPDRDPEIPWRPEAEYETLKRRAGLLKQPKDSTADA